MNPPNDKIKKTQKSRIEEDYLKRLENTFKTGAHLRPAKKFDNDEPEETSSEQSRPQPQSQTHAVKSLFQSPLIPQPHHNIQTDEQKPKAPATFYPGSILILEDGSIAIYKQKITGKEYDLVYILDPSTSKATPKGIYVSGYDVEAIGKLPEELFNKLQKTLIWNRDAIIYHLDKFIYCSRIPQVAVHIQEAPEPEIPEQIEPPPRPASNKKEILQKGRKLTISFGDREWDAYFWGEDELGSILVHSTHGKWMAMHLDIKRFGESIKYGELLSPTKINEIDHLLIQS